MLPEIVPIFGGPAPGFLKMINLFPGSWASVLVTSILGALAFFAIEFIRFKEKRSQGKISEATTFTDYILGYFDCFAPKKTQSVEDEKDPKEQAPGIRRGGSSTNLAGAVKERRKKLRKQNSVNSNDFQFSSLSCVAIIV